jgi:beta-alanine degradation protein BauB
MSGDVQRDVELEAESVGWLPAQGHHGENMGNTPTHVLFVELEENAPNRAGSEAADVGAIGPQPS